MSSITRDTAGRVIAYSATVGTLEGEILALAARDVGYRLSTPFFPEKVARSVRRNAKGETIGVRLDHADREKAAANFRTEQNKRLTVAALNWIERLYWHTENGMYAFVAANYARWNGQPTPEWAIDYFGDIGDRLWRDGNLTERTLVVRRADAAKDARRLAAVRVFQSLTKDEKLSHTEATQIIGDWLEPGKSRQNAYKTLIKPFLQLFD